MICQEIVHNLVKHYILGHKMIDTLCERLIICNGYLDKYIKLKVIRYCIRLSIKNLIINTDYLYGLASKNEFS